MVRVINFFDTQFSHIIISLDNNFEAAAQFAKNVEIILLPPARTRGNLRGMLESGLVLRRLRPDLLLTYNWGAIEWAIANRVLTVSRHVHVEDGFGKEEANRQIPRRVWCRRWGLTRCTRVVVPSRQLQELALNVWKLPAERVTYLPNGVDTHRFANPARDAIPGFVRRPSELVVGTVAPLRPEKNIGRLLRVFAALGVPGPTRLIIAGDGAERPGLERLAGELGISDRVVFTGHTKPEAVLGTFDIFAMSSDTEQMPIALLEAMAAGRAVAAVDVGDVKRIVSGENQNFIVPRDDSTAFASALEHLLGEDSTRAELGRANRARAVAEFSEERMFAAYAEIFGATSADK